MPLQAQSHKRKADTHKGDYGHVMVAGASPGLSGAVCLAAQAALRTGAGLVTAAVPRSLNQIFEIKLTEVMSLPLPETRSGTLSLKAFPLISSFPRKIDVLALGCGATTESSTVKLVHKIISSLDTFLILDADGINAVSLDKDILKKRKSSRLILTPHLGEFSRLTGKDREYIKNNRKELAKEFALRYNLILVLKGHRTLITDGDMVFENTTGNPGMATAGSGDVLTGIISGFAAQGMSPVDAACLGVYIHGCAGDHAADDLTQMCLNASDIIEYLPRAIKDSNENHPGL